MLTTTQLLNSALPENIHTLQTTSDCYSDNKNWMTQNKLQLNSEKTEPMLLGTRQKLSSISVNTLQLDDNTVPLADFVKNIFVLLDRTLSMENSSGKPPDSATTSSVELSLSGSIFPPRPQ